jgi:hypothetical protein
MCASETTTWTYLKGRIIFVVTEPFRQIDFVPNIGSHMVMSIRGAIREGFLFVETDRRVSNSRWFGGLSALPLARRRSIVLLQLCHFVQNSFSALLSANASSNLAFVCPRVKPFHTPVLEFSLSHDKCLIA